jgi:nicotinamide-nucleotide amidase
MVKEVSLGVENELLVAHGAVSAEVAEAMAQGARNALMCDVAIAITGIAGPGGGTQEKPVGTVFIHVATPTHSEGVSLGIMGSRDVVRARATTVALHLARRLVAEM